VVSLLVSNLSSIQSEQICLYKVATTHPMSGLGGVGVLTFGTVQATLHCLLTGRHYF